MIFLQVGSFFGGTIGNVLSQWEQLGVFSYALPFLIIFAIIFGTLSRMKMFDNKSIHMIISLSVALMALQFGFVTTFFSEIFPRLGIWLSVILVILIVFGIFNPGNRWPTGLMVLIGGIIVVIVLVQSFGVNWIYPNYWFAQNASTIIIVVAILSLIGWVWSSQEPSKPWFQPILEKLYAPQGH
mgnify:CR=1 FL=1